MVTLDDIAKLANVSRGTVDRAVNNRKGISSDTKIKILNLVSEMNYKTNNVGKALALHKRLNFGVIVPADVTPQDNMLFVQAMEGIKEAAEHFGEFGINIEIKQLRYPKVDEIAENIKYFISKKVIGLAIIPVVADDKSLNALTDIVDEAVAKKIHVITAYNDLENSKRHLFIGADFIKVGRIGAEYLCKLIDEKGKIALFTGFENNPVHSAKITGFKNKASERFEHVEIVGTYFNNFSEDIAHRACLQLIDSHPDIKGIAISCGGMAGIIEALRSKDLLGKVKTLVFDITPKTIELLESEDIDVIIGIDLYKQGYKSVKVLYDLIFSKIDSLEDNISNIDLILKESL